MHISAAANSQATYSVVLTSQPAATVVVELSPSGGVTVEGGCAAEATEGLAQCLVFTPENWNVAQETTLTVLTDGPAYVDHKVVSTDAGYNGLNARLHVNGAGAPENPVFPPLVVRQ